MQNVQDSPETRALILTADAFGLDTVTGEIVITVARPKPVTLAKAWRIALRWANAHRTLLIMSAVLLIAVAAQGINMLHYPYFEDDEGVYLSQAWAILHQGQLAPYTYWYDHAPFGWIQIAFWFLITGETKLFGTYLVSGRVLMLLVELVSSWLVFRIAQRLSGSVAIAVVATLLFSLSPYGLYFHRRILLDNFSTVWMLVAMALVLVPQRVKLHHIWLSGLALALSILSKEITVCLIPVMGYLAYYQAEKFQRLFALLGWLAVTFSVLSVYILMAVLKGELFPTGTLLGGTSRHVSLLGTLAFQSSRGKDGGFFDLTSSFWHQVSVWVSGGSASGDPLLVIGGTLCAVLSILIIRRHRLIGCVGLLTASIWVFLGRGGLTLEFYFIPMLPLLSLNIALMLGILARRLVMLRLPHVLRHVSGKRLAIAGTSLALVGLFAGCVAISPHGGYDTAKIALVWQSPQADPQYEALQWITQHVPAGSSIVMDDYLYTDLAGAGKNYKLYWHWKVDLDPAIHDNALHGDWNSVDYIITTPQLLYDTYHQPLPLVRQIFEHSQSLIAFDADHWRIDIRQVQHRTDGSTADANSTQSAPDALNSSVGNTTDAVVDQAINQRQGYPLMPLSMECFHPYSGSAPMKALWRITPNGTLENPTSYTSIKLHLF